MENELAKLADKESNKKYYFIDNGILNLFLINGETSLLENLVAIHLCRKYGRDNVAYYNSGKETDFVVADAKLAIQVSYSIKESSTYEREVSPLSAFVNKHPEWHAIVVTYDESATLEVNGHTISVLPAWKWMLNP